MVNKCIVTNYSTGYKTGQKNPSFHFHEDQENENGFICKTWQVHAVPTIIMTQGPVRHF